MAVDVKLHFACAFLFAELSEDVAKLRELLQELVRVGRSPDDRLEEERVFTLIKGPPPDLSKHETPSQEERFSRMYKDLQKQEEFTMSQAAEAQRVSEERTGLPSGGESVQRYDEACLRLTAWIQLEAKDNRSVMKLVELCKLLTRQWTI